MTIKTAALAISVLSVSLAACAQSGPVRSSQHLDTRDLPRTAAGAPPPVVSPSVRLPPPVARGPVELYSVVVNRVPVSELLFALARDAKLNVDVHPGIEGLVTLNAIDQTLPQILERVQRQADIRYTLEGNSLSVVPDRPFTRTYRVDYLHMERDTTGSISIATQVATTGGTSSSQGTGNNSSTQIASTTNHRYWQSLTQAVGQLLGILDAKGAVRPAAVLPAAAVSVGTTPGAVAPLSPDANAGNEPAVIAQPEAGLLIVRGTARQHAQVADFLDRSVTSARRQVMIEATVVEVQLSNQYQQGIDWQALRLGSTSLGFTVQPGPGTGTLPGGTPMSGQVPVMGVLEFAKSLAGIDISGALKLLESFGSTQVLSSPKVSVLNNQTALIKVVDNLVYFTLKADYTPPTTTTPAVFSINSTPNTVPVGFLMNVTPQVGEDGEVIMNLRPTISRLTRYVEDPGVALTLAVARQSGADVPDIKSQVPEIQTREMESVIKVRDGQIAVLGGLMRDYTDNGEDGVPGVSRVPGVGNLFKYKSRKREKSELVIFLRPIVVKNASLQGDYRNFRDQLPDGEFQPSAMSLPAPRDAQPSQPAAAPATVN
ncbi:secretin N-terminal domain-containing protein [Lysobacter korlensis]|uniref:Secretin N-terminal domain-containing protein n=1 Tax=Lysobacter korlensis TaxID=553636 RepID=A0ABV6S0H6_9GAMM